MIPTGPEQVLVCYNLELRTGLLSSSHPCASNRIYVYAFVFNINIKLEFLHIVLSWIQKQTQPKLCLTVRQHIWLSVHFVDKQYNLL